MRDKKREDVFKKALRYSKLMNKANDEHCPNLASDYAKKYLSYIIIIVNRNWLDEYVDYVENVNQ